MAYQNVGVPVFYIDSLNWRKSNGVDYIGTGGYTVDVVGSDYDIPADLVGLNPASQSIMHLKDESPIFSYVSYLQTTHTYKANGDPKNFVALLGHNSSWANCIFNINDSESSTPSNNSLVNYSGTIPSFGGWTLATNILFSDNANIWLYSTPDEVTGSQVDNKWGSVAYGNYYDMPHSPDLSLTMTREYGGIKTIETKGGSTLSNSFYRGSPTWGDAGAWELWSGDPTQQAYDKKLAKSGRRIWDLSFSYLQDSDMFPDVSSLTNYATINPDGATWDDSTSATDNTLLNEDTFYSQVIHKTNGGQLPFIFQPDGGTNGNNNPDQFAICKLDMKSFSFQQTAPNLYSVKMKIREVW